MCRWVPLFHGLFQLNLSDIPLCYFDVSRLNVDFVTSRGNLARMLNALGGKDSKGWSMLATRYRDTVYLSHIENDSDKDQSLFGQRVCYWGKRFEKEVTMPDCGERLESDHETARHGPIKAYPGFFSVVRFQLEDHTIVLRAEVDAQTQVGQVNEEVWLVFSWLNYIFFIGNPGVCIPRSGCSKHLKFTNMIFTR